MAEKLKRNELLVCIGQTALRGPDGTPLPSVPMYVIVNKKDVDPETGYAKREAKAFGNIASMLAPMFDQYMGNDRTGGWF